MNATAKILIVDDEPEMLSGCAKIIRSLGYQPFPIQDGSLAIKLIKEDEFDIILCDLLMPEIDGMQVLKAIQTYAPLTPVIVFTAYGTIDRVVNAMKIGAFDFIEKPFETDYLKVVLQKGLEQRNLFLERANLIHLLEDKYSFENIIGQSPAMRRVFEMVESVAQSDANVLITGESGTGKELIARSIHARSKRRTKSFVPVNCGAFPENLFEAELFGYEKGAFTGATQNKIGLLEFATNGTFFLDEVCEFPLNLQTKLLRVLQDQQLRHLGGNELIQTNVRLISATNRNMQQALSNGIMREDFYYRLNVINIEMPPLRERKEDISLLAKFLFQKILKSSPKIITDIDNDVILLLEKYNWPGNVRELENVIERAVTLAKGDRITTNELPAEINTENDSTITFNNLSLQEAKKKTISELERKYLINLLKKHKGIVTKIADEAGMTRRNIHRILNNHKIDPNSWR
ncbi:MAG: sigma-54 dependent transcriptional regulator [Bacteroidetes bacterium]|nr:sigma-54 dependent transcriptional regulator [Bacteroidota bacterium]MBU1681123.1 sigma-54 dependent transcriptional regulator [Bacteroidota bacterium]